MTRTLGLVLALGLALVSVSACQPEPPPDPSKGREADVAIEAKADRAGRDCSLVRCAEPLCAEGQHLSYQGSCCPTCVGNEKKPSRCATVLCAAVVCEAGYEPVVPNGQCCPTCQPVRNAAECQSDSDCPQYYCIQCPCPYSECQGRKCVTRTPDADSCGGNL